MQSNPWISITGIAYSMEKTSPSKRPPLASLIISKRGEGQAYLTPPDLPQLPEDNATREPPIFDGIF